VVTQHSDTNLVSHSDTILVSHSDTILVSHSDTILVSPFNTFMYFRELFFFYFKKLWNAVSPVDKNKNNPGTWEVLTCEYWRKSLIIGENYWLSKTDIATKTLPYDGDAIESEILKKF
jgi:hypothetical protein